jgi:GMP synthase-like glutamine amidotransferase
MHIHWIQHVPFEGLGCIEPWLTENGHTVTCTRLCAGEKFPNLGLSAGALAKEEKIDGLIVMGGPMGVCDEAIYPWLAAEKAFIKAVIDQDKPVLGICLGAQLIAEVLGGDVWPAKNKEIGFYLLRRHKFPMVGKSFQPLETSG